MLGCILLLTFFGISQGYLVFDKINVTADIKDGGQYFLKNRKPINEGPIPDFLDWRDKDAVSPVKDQLKCNACWAFAIVAAVESHWRIHTGAKEMLSEQFLIDCDTDNPGCKEASLLQSYSHIVSKIGGILRDVDYYPYEVQQYACRWKPPGKNSISPGSHNYLMPKEQISRAYPVPVIGFSRVKPDEDKMVESLFKFGPLTAAINSASMTKYTRGIDEPTDAQCEPGAPDHTVLIVGYNEYVPQDPKERRVKYWIIKNSWGKQWGDKGFYYLVRGRNACGIANDVSFPLVPTIE